MSSCNIYDHLGAKVESCGISVGFQAKKLAAKPWMLLSAQTNVLKLAKLESELHVYLELANSAKRYREFLLLFM